MAWACGPSGYGVPEQPAAPPVSTAQPTGTPTTAPAPEAPAPAPVTPSARPTPSSSASGAERSSATTRGADFNSGGNTGGGGDSGGGGGSGSLQSGGGDAAAGPSATGQAAIAARVSGATAGVTKKGEQSVFKSSTARKTPAAGAVSATEDLWTAAPSGSAKSSLASAEEIGGDGGGLGTALIAGIAVLGLGLVGITAGALVAEVRRRRSEGTTGAPPRH